MIRKLSALLFSAWLGAVPAAWSAPLIVTDIPAIHSLVATVMGDTGVPVLLLNAGSSPHDYSLRPSEARLLQKADLIIWTSSVLTPWLPKAMNALAPELNSLELLAAEHSIRLPPRISPDFEHDDHDHDGAHEETAIDPHGWLSTVNARYWLQLTADKLAALDPQNAEAYQQNADRGVLSLEALDSDIETLLEGVRGKPFVVFHDSYHYFEDQYHFPAIASISLTDGTAPGIRQLDALRKTISQYPGSCVFSEPQFSERLIDAITEKLDLRRGVLDPLGSTLEPGATLYSHLLRDLATRLRTCLDEDS